MYNSCNTKYKHLTIDLRKLIEKWKKERKRVRILGKTIEERPKEINNREEVGHYEIDTVILRKEKGQCLLTLTDRKSRYE